VAGLVLAVAALIKATSKDPTLNKLADLQTSRGTSDLDLARKESLLSEQLTAGAISPEDYKRQLKELEDAYAKEVATAWL
jgi:hypothetical protein